MRDLFEPSRFPLLEAVGPVEFTVVKGRWRPRTHATPARLDLVWIADPQLPGWVLTVGPASSMADGAAWLLPGPPVVDPWWAKKFPGTSALRLPNPDLSTLRVVFDSPTGAEEAVRQKESWRGGHAFFDRVEPLLAGDHDWVEAKPLVVKFAT